MRSPVALRAGQGPGCRGSERRSREEWVLGLSKGEVRPTTPPAPRARAEPASHPLARRGRAGRGKRCSCGRHRCQVPRPKMEPEPTRPGPETPPAAVGLARGASAGYREGPAGPPAPGRREGRRAETSLTWARPAPEPAPAPLRPGTCVRAPPLLLPDPSSGWVPTVLDLFGPARTTTAWSSGAGLEMQPWGRSLSRLGSWGAVEGSGGQVRPESWSSKDWSEVWGP